MFMGVLAFEIHLIRSKAILDELDDLHRLFFPKAHPLFPQTYPNLVFDIFYWTIDPIGHSHIHILRTWQLQFTTYETQVLQTSNMVIWRVYSLHILYYSSQLCMFYGFKANFWAQKGPKHNFPNKLSTF